MSDAAGSEETQRNATGVPARGVAPREFPVDLRQEARDYEMAAIHEALAAARHDQRRAAELLKLTCHQFRGYQKKHEILKQD